MEMIFSGSTNQAVLNLISVSCFLGQKIIVKALKFHATR
jgi:hypothetical protein